MEAQALDIAILNKINLRTALTHAVGILLPIVLALLLALGAGLRLSWSVPLMLTAALSLFLGSLLLVRRALVQPGRRRLRARLLEHAHTHGLDESSLIQLLRASKLVFALDLVERQPGTPASPASSPRPRTPLPRPSTGPHE